MFSGIWFILKTFVFTVIMLSLLQFKYGDKTLEERATLWVQQSNIVAPLERFSVQVGQWLKKDNKVDFSFSKLWESVKVSSGDALSRLNKTLTETGEPKEKPKKEKPKQQKEKTTSESGSFQWG